MSTLTKVLIVVNVILAILITVPMIQYVNTTQNYKQAYDRAQSKLADASVTRQQIQAQAGAAQDKLNNQLQDAQKTITDLQTANAQQTQALAKAQNDLAATQSQLAVAQATTNGQSHTIQTQTDMIKSLNDQLGQVQGQLAHLNTQNADLVQRNSTLQLEVQHASAANQALQETLAQRNRVIEDLQKSGAQVAKQGQPAPAQGPASPINGSITLVNDQQNLAQINVGSADGVTKGMRFTIYRLTDGTANFIGTLQVDEVQPNNSAGVLSQLQRNPQPGDKVTTKL